MLLAPHPIRSERWLRERVDTDLHFRWFLDLEPGDDASDPAASSHNRRRPGVELTRAFFDAVVAEAPPAGLCREHFSVGGTLIKGTASAESSQPTPPRPAEACNLSRLREPAPAD